MEKFDEWVSVRMIDCQDFDPYVSEVFGAGYSTQRGYDYAAQDTVAVVTTDGQYMDEEDLDISEWLESKDPDDSPHPGAILYHLHQRGLIDEGDYNIRIWW